MSSFMAPNTFLQLIFVNLPVFCKVKYKLEVYILDWFWPASL